MGVFGIKKKFVYRYYYFWYYWWFFDKRMSFCVFYLIFIVFIYIYGNIEILEFINIWYLEIVIEKIEYGVWFFLERGCCLYYLF